ncbi:MAG TPA: hypothetical protein VMR50_17020 [Myxococcota bacterium]|nr:hypothetical protein [Myxococcota bacterium]
MRTGIRARLQTATLIAVFALLSHALLPYLHALEPGCEPANHTHLCAAPDHGQSAPAHEGGSNHSDECPVCSALAHGGARAVDAPIALPLASVEVQLSALPPVSLAAAPSRDLDVACARAPPRVSYT